MLAFPLVFRESSSFSLCDSFRCEESGPVRDRHGEVACPLCHVSACLPCTLPLSPLRQGTICSEEELLPDLWEASVYPLFLILLFVLLGAREQRELRLTTMPE